MISYRGFEIHAYLTETGEDLYDVAFQIKGGSNLGVLGPRADRIALRNGPFTRRWSYLIAECAGQAAIDVLLGTGDGQPPAMAQ
jgi:hypothetical protein